MSTMFRQDIDLAHLNELEGLRHHLTFRLDTPPKLTIDDYKALSKKERASYDEARAWYTSGGIRVRTPVRDEIVKLYRGIRRANVYADNRTGLILDAPGHSGKTTVAQELMEWTYAKYLDDFPDAERDGHIPIVYVEATPRSSGRSLLKAFCEFFGLTVPSGLVTDDLLRDVIKAMRKARTQLVIIDEFHNIAARNAGNGETVDYIKELTNAVRATFVLSGIHVRESEILAGARGNQLSSRFVRQELPAYSVSSKPRLLEWQQLLLNFERSLPLLAQRPKSILELAEQLHRDTKGSIGALHKLLTRTTIDLIFDAEAEDEFLSSELLSHQRRDITSEALENNDAA